MSKLSIIHSQSFKNPKQPVIKITDTYYVSLWLRVSDTFAVMHFKKLSENITLDYIYK